MNVGIEAVAKLQCLHTYFILGGRLTGYLPDTCKTAAQCAVAKSSLVLCRCHQNPPKSSTAMKRKVKKINTHDAKVHKRKNNSSLCQIAEQLVPLTENLSVAEDGQQTFPFFPQSAKFRVRADFPYLR